jgi:hypothetical protein
MDMLQKAHKKEITNELPGFMSLRFTASTPVSVSMSYSADDKSPGRCYLEVFGLFKFFQSVQGYDALSRPISELSIEKYQVSRDGGFFFFLFFV